MMSNRSVEPHPCPWACLQQLPGKPKREDEARRLVATVGAQRNNSGKAAGSVRATGGAWRRPSENGAYSRRNIVMWTTDKSTCIILSSKSVLGL